MKRLAALLLWLVSWLECNNRRRVPFCCAGVEKSGKGACAACDKGVDADGPNLKAVEKAGWLTGVCTEAGSVGLLN